jgi:hypothetical protein
LGEHYLIDLVVAFPFALAVFAISGREQSPQARRVAMAGAALTTAWLVYLATGVAMFALVGKLHLVAMIATLATTFHLRIRLDQA